MRKRLLVISSWFIVVLVTAGVVRADECDSISGLSLDQIAPCISKFSGFADAISKANTTNQQELNSLNAQISKLKAQINQLNAQIQKLTKDVFDREVKIGVRETLLAARVKRDYIRKKDQPILLLLFSSDNATNFFRDLGYRERLAKEDQEQIASVSGEVSALNAQRTALNAQKENLDALRKRVDDQATFLAGEVAKANKYVSDLSGKIASLTARQNELLAAKTGTYQTSVGDVPLADDANARPTFDPGFRPAFALFSFGAPHFKGMSQYGAFGRAKNGQSYEDILRAYYGNVRIQDVNTSLSLRTTAGTMDFENRYVMGIAEMPGQWGDEGGMEALKAQAIAARSYALA
ncbi:MAG: SpoIID/LytB domain-containing protein, partial [Patescibacteria group bacterium]